MRRIGILQLMCALACLVLGWLMWRADDALLYAGAYLPQVLIALLLLLAAAGNFYADNTVGNGGETARPKYQGPLLVAICGAMLLVFRYSPLIGRGRRHQLYTVRFLEGFHDYIEPFSLWLLLLGCVIIATAVLSYVLEYSAWKQNSRY